MLEWGKETPSYDYSHNYVVSTVMRSMREEAGGVWSPSRWMEMVNLGLTLTLWSKPPSHPSW